jgi:hypothetical protein
MLGWTGATPTAAGRDVVSSGVWSEGALPGDRRKEHKQQSKRHHNTTTIGRAQLPTSPQSPARTPRVPAPTPPPGSQGPQRRRETPRRERASGNEQVPTAHPSKSTSPHIARQPIAEHLHQTETRASTPTRNTTDKTVANPTAPNQAAASSGQRPQQNTHQKRESKNISTQARSKAIHCNAPLLWVRVCLCARLYACLCFVLHFACFGLSLASMWIVTAVPRHAVKSGSEL